MKLSTAIHEFLRDCVASQYGYSKSTISGYGQDLQKLLPYCSHDTVLDFTEDTLNRFFRGESARGLSLSTLARHQVCLRTFARWGLRKKLWTANPMDTLPVIRKPARLPRPFSADEWNRLLQLALPEYQAVARAVLAYMGMRVAACRGILLGHINFSPTVMQCGNGQEITVAGTIRTIGKGNRERVLPMLGQLRDYLYQHVASRPDARAHHWLVLNHNGAHPCNHTVERWCHAWGQRAGVPDCTPHRFRHSFATMLLERGADIRVVQELMGHATIQSTMIYTQVSNAKMAQATSLMPGHYLVTRQDYSTPARLPEPALEVPDFIAM